MTGCEQCSGWNTQRICVSSSPFYSAFATFRCISLHNFHQLMFNLPSAFSYILSGFACIYQQHFHIRENTESSVFYTTFTTFRCISLHNFHQLMLHLPAAFLHIIAGFAWLYQRHFRIHDISNNVIFIRICCYCAQTLRQITTSRQGDNHGHVHSTHNLHMSHNAALRSFNG